MGRGQLVFKGEKPSKKKKATKHKSDPLREEQQHVTQAEAADSAPAQPSMLVAAATTTASTKPPSTPTVQKGIGKITTSGTVVTGHGTQFTRQLNVGDAMLVTQQGQQEMRVVTMRLSDTSINLSSVLSNDVKHPSDFEFIVKPRAAASLSKQSNNDNILKQEEQAAFGTFSSHKELIYHEKTEHGSYRIKKQTVEGDVTRSDLLQMRAKRKSDKYC
ncbi:hypothetical protein MPSEU_000065100 [Mayamaea pseudoterrestris]|nr:hypothetical protein MPSEU_000063900 [Mayamaea pseudoterrestris]GKY90923.1 hypothetical protein MPSEU_000065100 [Mayamaea pseudoterrestris]